MTPEIRHRKLASRYEIQQVLKAEGERRVWRVFDRLAGRLAIAKGCFCGEEQGAASEVVLEFERLKRYQHPRIAAAFDFHVVESVPNEPGIGRFVFFTQEWIPGRSLWELRGRLKVSEVARCAEEILGLLAYLHRQRLTRLDLKPAHLLQADSGWHLIDLDQAALDRPLAAASLTGTLAYLAPEILSGGDGGARSDLYSLGAILFEVLTGASPLPEAKTLEEVCQRLPESPRPELPASVVEQAPRLAGLVHALLARAPFERPESGGEALEMLGIPPDLWRVSAPLPPGSFVGREEILTRLEQAYGRATRTRGLGLRIEGPARSGMSRLLQEVAGRWQILGRPVLRLTPDLIPSRSLGAIDIIRYHLNTLAVQLSELEPSRPSAESAPTTREAREVCIHQAVGQLREAGARAQNAVGGPVPILFDGLSALDGLSLEVLERIVPILEGSGLCLVFGVGERVIAWMSMFERVVPGPLSAGDLRVLAEELMGPGAVTADECLSLISITAGRVGWLRDALTLRWQRSDASFEGWFPRDAEALVCALLESLGPEVAAIAHAASTLDGPFTAPVLAEVVGSPLRAGAITTLLDRGLLESIRTDPGAEPILRFSSEAARRAIEATLDPETRRELHGRAAEALEQHLRVDPNVTAARLAQHFLSSGLTARARPYLRLALDEAMQSLCLAETCHLLQQLIDITRGGDPQRVELYRRLGDIHLELGSPGLSLDAFSAALREDDGAVPQRQARLLAGTGRAMTYLGRLQDARDTFDRVLGDPAQLEGLPSAEVVPWWHQLAWVCLENNALERARDALKQARAAGLVVGSRMDVDQVHLEAYLGLKEGARADLLSPPLLEALELARQLAYRRGELNVINTLAQICHFAGDVAGARRWLEALIELSRAAYDLMREATVSHNLGLLLRDAGDSEEALTWFERAAELYRCVHNREREAANILIVAELLIDHGRLERIDAYLERARRALSDGALEDAGGRWQEQFKAGHLYLELLEAQVRLHRGDQDDLGAELERIQTGLEAAGQPLISLLALSARMELALSRGKPLEALALYASVATRTANDDERAAWRRIHTLAIRAHEAQLPAMVSDAAREREEAKTKASAGGEKKTPGAPDRGNLRQPPSTEEGERETTRESAAEGGRSAVEAREDEGALAKGTGRGLRIEGGRSIGGEDPIRWLTRLRRLLDVADDEEALATELAALAGEMLSGRGLVFLFDGSHPQVVRGYQMAEYQVDDISNTLIERVRSGRTPYVCADIQMDTEVGQYLSLRESNVHSVICYPVMRANACLGVVYVDHRKPGLVSRPFALDVIGRVAELAGECLEGIARRRRRRSASSAGFGLIGESEPMQRLRTQISDIARSTSPDLVVLLRGDTGVGKSMIARAIHAHGSRSAGPFVEINCASITDSLFEELMFGHEKGVFTGANSSKPGWFEVAKGGTLFLDEIGYMPVRHQAGLLTVLGNRKFSRIGAGAKEQDLDSHIICATNRDLREEVREGRFLNDLLRRININVCKIPSLHERGAEDIGRLASHMITGYLVSQQVLPAGTEPVELRDYFTRGAESFLNEYEWPWNVGEMANLFRNETVRRVLRTRGEEKVDQRLVQEALELDISVLDVDTRGDGAGPVHEQDREAEMRALRNGHAGAARAGSEPEWKGAASELESRFDEDELKLLALLRRYRFRVSDCSGDPDCPVERATADSYLRVLMFKSLNFCEWSFGDAARLLAGDGDPKLQHTVRRRMETTLSNLRQRLLNEGEHLLKSKLSRHYRTSYCWVEPVLEALKFDRIRVEASL